MRMLYEELCGLLGETRVKLDEPMKNHTTFRIGGPASFYVTPETAEQIAGVISLCGRHESPYYVLGNGSNLLVSDAGFDGVVIAMDPGFKDIGWDDTCVRAGAGALLSAVARQALERGLTGMEFAAGIPGTVGGALVMNAGAYGGEMKDIVRAVIVQAEDGKVHRLAADELALGYRTSCIPANRYIVLEAELELKAGTAEQIRGRMDDFAQQRRTKQPLEYPSAGSTFKRPEGYFAGKLIEDAGLKGFRIGGAQVAEKHSGFVVNRGGATASDVIGLCRHVQDEIERQFDVRLEMEVKTLGEI